MPRKIETNVTKADLQKPAVNIKDAVSADPVHSTTTGALLLPVDQSISESLEAPIIPESTDWMLRGDPTAPALKDLELRAQQAREEAMARMQASGSSVLPLPPFDPRFASGASNQTDQNTFTQPSLGIANKNSFRRPTNAYPWSDLPAQPVTPQPDDIPTIWDNAASQPVTTQPVSEPPLAMTYTYSLPAAMPENAPVRRTNGEVTIHIKHKPLTINSELYTPIETISSADINVRKSKTDTFASGVAVQIPHDSAMNSLPVSQSTKFKTGNGSIL